MTIQSTSTFQITVKVEGGNGTVNGTTSATVTFDYNTSAEDVAKAFNIVAAPGYTFAAPDFETVTADKTYTVTFTHATYPVTGVEGVKSATHGTDLTFTPKLEDELLLVCSTRWATASLWLWSPMRMAATPFPVTRSSATSP